MPKKTTRGYVFWALGLIFSILPALLATLFYFPVWSERGGAASLSGVVLVLLLLSFLPLFNIIRERLRSPSAHTVWLIIFISFFLLSKIADEVTVISFFGFVGNLIGAVFFKLSNKNKIREAENEG